MAKTYINTVKYMVKAEFEIDGIVDKPDIVGAVFGQSEGLLGSEMDLKELQKNGKIGRIEIEPVSAMGKTKGKLILPSSMDKVDTALLAAAVESVDKVGPCTAKFQITGIEDTRSVKRTAITSRAKELLKKLNSGLPEKQEMEETVLNDLKAGEIQSHGKDSLPAGPEINSNPEIIVVEGRADVLNLLRHGIKNAIGMGGSNISQDVIDLCPRKTVTVFVDGDRGGELNVRKLQQLTKVDFLARAPDGKEVEELTGKEILTALRRQIPADETRPQRRTRTYTARPASTRTGSQTSYTPRTGQRRTTGRPRISSSSGYRPRTGRDRTDSRSSEYRPRRDSSSSRGRMDSRPGGRGYGRSSGSYRPRYEPVDPMIQEFKPLMQELNGSLKARIINEQKATIKELAVRELIKEIPNHEGGFGVVFDGIVTKRLAEEADKAGIRFLVGCKKTNIPRDLKTRVVIVKE